MNTHEACTHLPDLGISTITPILALVQHVQEVLAPIWALVSLDEFMRKAVPYPTAITTRALVSSTPHPSMPAHLIRPHLRRPLAMPPPRSSATSSGSPHAPLCAAHVHLEPLQPSASSQCMPVVPHTAHPCLACGLHHAVSRPCHIAHYFSAIAVKSRQVIKVIVKSSHCPVNFCQVIVQSIFVKS